MDVHFQNVQCVYANRRTLLVHIGANDNKVLRWKLVYNSSSSSGGGGGGGGSSRHEDNNSGGGSSNGGDGKGGGDDRSGKASNKNNKTKKKALLSFTDVGYNDVTTNSEEVLSPVADFNATTFSGSHMSLAEMLQSAVRMESDLAKFSLKA